MHYEKHQVLILILYLTRGRGIYFSQSHDRVGLCTFNHFLSGDPKTQDSCGAAVTIAFEQVTSCVQMRLPPRTRERYAPYCSRGGNGRRTLGVRLPRLFRSSSSAETLIRKAKCPLSRFQVKARAEQLRKPYTHGKAVGPTV